MGLPNPPLYVLYRTRDPEDETEWSDLHSPTPVYPDEQTPEAAREKFKGVFEHCFGDTLEFKIESVLTQEQKDNYDRRKKEQDKESEAQDKQGDS